MRAFLLIGLLALAISIPAANGAPPQDDSSRFRIVGYLPDYRAAEFDVNAARSLTDLVVFSAEPAANGDIDLSRLKDIPWTRLREFKTRERVRLILCVGGWERSQHFAALAKSAEKRKAFVKAAVRVCLAERIDGLDIDWEHPQDDQEQEGYSNLLSELHDAFVPHGLVLSVTVAAWQKLPSRAFSAVDWIHVMAYDHESRHSTIESAKADVDSLLSAGAPAEKIVLGLPFYGRGIENRDRTLTYREIVNRYHPGPSLDEVDGVYFNGVNTIRMKTQYAVASGLAGVMVWEIGQDVQDQQSLLNAIHQTAMSIENRK